jgi:hypothetical protein
MENTDRHARAHELRMQSHRDCGFVAGVLTGAVVGAGLGMWLVPRYQRVRDEVADAVAHGAHEVERYATAAKTDRAATSTRTK